MATISLCAALTVIVACTENGPDMAALPDAEPGDPTVYAPDGWPLQIGDRISVAEEQRLRERFRLPGVTRRSVWGGYIALNLVGDRVYAALIQWDESKLNDYVHVYRGHFPIRVPEWKRELEPYLPAEYHGKIEYATWPPLHPRSPDDSIAVIVIDPGKYDADGRLLIVDPDYVPHPPDPRMWPDYPERGMLWRAANRGARE